MNQKKSESIRPARPRQAAPAPTPGTAAEAHVEIPRELRRSLFGIAVDLECLAARLGTAGADCDGPTPAEEVEADALLVKSLAGRFGALFARCAAAEAEITKLHASDEPGVDQIVGALCDADAVRATVEHAADFAACPAKVRVYSLYTAQAAARWLAHEIQAGLDDLPRPPHGPAPDGAPVEAGDDSPVHTAATATI